MKRIVIGLVLGALMALGLATGASARTITLEDLNAMLYPQPATLTAQAAHIAMLDSVLYPDASPLTSFSGHPY